LAVTPLIWVPKRSLPSYFSRCCFHHRTDFFTLVAVRCQPLVIRNPKFLVTLYRTVPVSSDHSPWWANRSIMK
jgi:hypothetical protein